MKKLLICLPILFVVTLVFANKLFYSCKLKPVNKEINLAIFTENNYHAAVYDSSLAQVEVTIKKISGNASQIVLTKTFEAMLLKQYASVKNALTEQMSIGDIQEANEYLEITYTVAYTTKGSLLYFENSEIVGKGEMHKKINVVI